MINRNELQFALDSISIDIFDEVVSDLCNVPKGSIVADTYLTELNEFFEDAKDEKVALKKIAFRYSLSSDSVEYLENLPIVEIALYILINGKYNEDYKGVK